MTILFETFSARRTAEICGFRTVAMLDYLERSEVFIPSKKRAKHRGKGRKFTFRELLVLKAISSLLSNGASVASLRVALRQFQLDKWSADRASLANGDEIIRYVVLSGNKVIYAQGRQSIFDLTNDGQMVFNFVIDLDRLHSQLCNDLDQKTLFPAAMVR